MLKPAFFSKRYSRLSRVPRSLPKKNLCESGQLVLGFSDDDDDDDDECVTVYTVAAGGVLLPVEEVGDSVHDSTSSPAQTPDTEASGADAHSAI